VGAVLIRQLNRHSCQMDGLSLGYRILCRVRSQSYGTAQRRDLSLILDSFIRGKEGRQVSWWQTARERKIAVLPAISQEHKILGRTVVTYCSDL